MTQTFDPDAASGPDAGIFGLDCPVEESAIVLVPVPFDATASYGVGAAAGPDAILRASHQVDLFDFQTGRPYLEGIHMLPVDAKIRDASEEARTIARPLIEKGGAGADDAACVRAVDAICTRVHDDVEEQVAAVIDRGKIPGVVGGDHSVALGGIRAVASAWPGLGILHLDAHADLRHKFEGFTHSHASIMDNVLREAPNVARLVQIGIRDVGEQEMRAATEDPRVTLHHDLQWKARLADGETFRSLCDEAIAALPQTVHVSFDIDGLDPSLCPNTGTPVPGGLAFHEACLLLQALVDSGRRIVGFDLTEVAPGDGDDEWDANVGARVLYKLCGFALLGRQ